MDDLNLFDPKGNPEGTVFKDLYLGDQFIDEALTKAQDDDDDSMQFDVTASDESVDRMGDIIRAEGWDFRNFRKNNIVLAQHRSDFPVGTVPRVWQEDTDTLATIAMAEPGTTTKVDETRSLLRQKVLKAVSVGFIPKKWAFIEGSDRFGIEFMEQELTEISIVSVPANANAEIHAGLNVSRAYGCTPEQLRQLAMLAQQRAHQPRLIAARHQLRKLALHC